MSIPKGLKSLWAWLFHFSVWQNPPKIKKKKKKKSMGAIFFPTAFAHFLPLCHILVLIILAIFQTSLLLYLLWWSVINDLWCFCCSCLGISFFFFFFGSEVVLRFIYLFIHSFISSDGSSLRQSKFFLVAGNRGYSSLRWSLLLWSTGCRRTGFKSCGSRRAQ